MEPAKGDIMLDYITKDDNCQEKVGFMCGQLLRNFANIPCNDTMYKSCFVFSKKKKPFSVKKFSYSHCDPNLLNFFIDECHFNQFRCI